ncbi:MAG: SusD/RagB family nutrient-binding outer membrane lipoprotein, partial [Cytophagales bacterium CG18_big_fil_WC_8_21_14_2_50_42_9]
MKKFFRIFLFSALALSAVSCEQFLDINENPNQATASSPQQVLPNALTVTAANLVSYNDYGAWHVGYVVNAGGFGGWGTQWTYNYTTSTYSGLWGSTYDNLEDYDYIEEQTEGNEVLAYYNAIAKIMKAYNFQMLVDTYGDVPYTEALGGVENLTPKYDDAETIYQDLVTQLDAAISMIDNSAANAITTGDVMFNGDMERWKRFANTVKLRILIRASRKPIAGNSQTPEWVTTGFTSFGASTAFLT